MPRTTYQPLADLAAAIPVDTRDISPETETHLCAAFEELLLGNHFFCNGFAKGRERDPGWHGDIGRMVAAAKRHTYWARSEGGLDVPQEENILLPTLKCEVDDNGEICCWTYDIQIYPGSS